MERGTPNHTQQGCTFIYNCRIWSNLPLDQAKQLYETMMMMQHLGVHAVPINADREEEVAFAALARAPQGQIKKPLETSSEWCLLLMQG